MKIKTSGTPVLYLVALLLAAVLGCAAVLDKTRLDPPRMQPEELKARLDDPSLAIIDVRADLDEESGPGRIQGAVLEIYNEVANWAPKYPKDKTIVLYCA